MVKVDRFAEPVFLLALVVWVIVGAWSGVSGTSIGVYHNFFYGEDQPDPALIFGKPQEIRADEYRVATNWTSAQSQRDFPIYNDLFGISGQALFFYDVPVKDFTLIFKPHLWAFPLLPLEHAFAYKWWFRAALLILALYLTFRRFTRRKVLLSIGAAFALFFSSFIQWWYSINLIDTITYYLLLYEVFIRLVEYRRTAEPYLYAGLFAYIVITLIFYFYPPALISVGWVFIILAAGYVWHRRELLTRQRAAAYLKAGAVSATLIVGFVLAFYLQYRQVLQLVTNTIYPGQRTAPQAGVNLWTLLGGFFNIQLLQTLISIPNIFPSNQCEASGFFLFAIFLLPVMLVLLVWEYRRARRINFWSLLTSLAFLVFLLWVLNPPPLPVASLFLLSKVPAYRMTLALGALNFVLVFWYLFGVTIPRHPLYRWACLGYAVLVFLFYAGFGYYLKNNFQGFIASQMKIFIIALFAGLAFYFLLQKRAYAFVALLLVFSFFSSYSVNPLYRGLGELTEGKLAQAIRAINQRDGSSARWVLYDPRLANFLQANGARGLNGVYYYPDFDLYRVLDPTGKYTTVYNRYSHALYLPEDNSQPRFQLLSNDAYALYINPCSDALKALNVKYQVFFGPSNADCLQQVEQIQYPQGDFYIYEYK